MQRKLMLYWVSMILVVFAAVILLLSIAGAFSRDDEQLHEVMELHLSNTGDTLASQLDHLTAQSLNLSKELSREIEGALVQEGISLQEVNDDPERLLKLQQIMYPLVNTTLQTANCNGAYVILNATANTTLEVADHSRSGLYLRYTNLSASNPVAPTVVYFRGIPDIARQKDLELHNRWNLEFDTDQIPGCRELMDAPLRPACRPLFLVPPDRSEGYLGIRYAAVCPHRGQRRNGVRRLRRGAQRPVLPAFLSRPGGKVRLRRYRSGSHPGQPSPAAGWIGGQRQRYLPGRSGDSGHPSGAIL